MNCYNIHILEFAYFFFCVCLFVFSCFGIAILRNKNNQNIKINTKIEKKIKLKMKLEDPQFIEILRSNQFLHWQFYKTNRFWNNLQTQQ